ncbi:MAG: hypothetical protein JSU87_03000 [Gemmatimonadota bacterium]|nr:MAG: hypothetical protein JSU87_03000 [Gemmatimonadota bacterium]
MYRTCIYCNRDLGSNQSVESFPVGRRLAYDQGKGRLWVVCDGCRCWNLTPLEERWEAIEECERQFRDTTIRFSTDNIGLARLREGIDLVRIGRPLRPEFAAWRYGREFLRRRIAVETAVALNAFLAAYDSLVEFFTGGEKQRVVARARAEDGERLVLTRHDLREVRLEEADNPEGWVLSVPHRAGRSQREWWGDYAGADGAVTELRGAAALRAAGKLLPKINPYGGTDRQVRDAVEIVEEAMGVVGVFKAAARRPGYAPGRLFDRDVSVLKTMRPERRLALELAAHEETERRALEGELEELEEAWREAEEIAAIADRLLMPEEIEEWIRERRREWERHREWRGAS